MSESIWIVIGDTSKLKVVSFEHPPYQTLDYPPEPHPQHAYIREEPLRGDFPQTRYDYRVVREYQASQEPAYEEEMDSNEPSAPTFQMSEDPEFSALTAKLSVYLSRAKLMGKFDRLILVASKEVLANIRSALTPQLQELIIVELEMELADADPATLRANLPANV